MGATRFNLYTQFNALAVTGTNTYTSQITDINQQHNVGLDVRFTGTMAGTFSVQCSNDGVTFTALTFSPALSQPSGSSLNYLIDLNQVPFKFIEVVYMNASGSGNITSILSSKDLS